MNTTGKQLVDHWTWAASKGLMNQNSANGFRSACAQVLGVLDNWEQIDVSSLDVEDVIKRFQNLRARDFSPDSLSAYARRFRSAIESFLLYVKDPSSWKPTARPVRAQGEGNGRAKKNYAPTAQPNHVTREKHDTPLETTPLRGLIEYPFPLRDDLVARLMLPRDITIAEAKRLFGFMTALAVDQSVEK